MERRDEGGSGTEEPDAVMQQNESMMIPSFC
jgi:hypothetical protein